jgi:biotin synthase-like enzyme
MTDEMRALCFFAGANSIVVGDRLAAGNPGEDQDAGLFRCLGEAIELHAGQQE